MLCLESMDAVSIIIPSWDGADLLARTLPTVLRQTGLAYEVIVVDNGSPFADSKELVEKLARKHSELRLITLNRQAGYTGAVNAGVVAAKFRHVAVLGNDNNVPPGWLESLKELWGNGIDPKSGQAIGAVMSQTQVGSEIPPGPCTLNHFGRNVFFHDPKWRAVEQAPFYPGGNAFVFDREALGIPFEEFYFAYHEDVALGWRCRNLGLAVLETKAPWMHSFDGGSTKRPKLRFRTLMLTERNRWLNLLTFPSLSFILRMAPLWYLDATAAIFFARNRRAKIQAWLWLLGNFGKIIRLRQKRQAEKTEPDSRALSSLALLACSTEPPQFGIRRGIRRFLNLSFRAYARLLCLPGRKIDL